MQDANAAYLMAFFAGIGSLFYAFRNGLSTAWQYLESTIIVRLKLWDIGIPYSVFYSWLETNGRRLKRSRYAFDTALVRVKDEFAETLGDTYLNSHNGYYNAVYEESRCSSIWWLGGLRFVWVSYPRQQANHPASIKPGDSETHPEQLSFAFVFGTFNVHKLICTLHDYERRHLLSMRHGLAAANFAIYHVSGNARRFNQQGNPQPAIGPQNATPRTNNGSYNCQIGRIDNTYPFDHTAVPMVNVRREDIHRGLLLGDRMQDLWLSESVKELQRELRFWYKSRSWYAKRGIDWKLGIGLVGKPGNGKTAFIRAMGAELGVPVYSFDLATFTNQELFEAWENTAKHRTPCFCVLEDLDRVFAGSTALDGVELTFDVLLKMLDGLEQYSGIVTFVTSNHPEKLDEALMTRLPDGSYKTRPGRIDTVVEFFPPDEEGRRLIAKRVLIGFESHIEEVVQIGKGDSGATFQRRCCQYAEQLYWDQYEQQAKFGEEAGCNHSSVV